MYFISSYFLCPSFSSVFNSKLKEKIKDGNEMLKGKMVNSIMEIHSLCKSSKAEQRITDIHSFCKSRKTKEGKKLTCAFFHLFLKLL